MKRRISHRIGMVASAMTLALVATSCATSPPPKESPPTLGPITATGTVTIWVGSWWESQLPLINELWQKDNPGIKLDIQPLPNNGYVEKFTTSALGGDPPDVIDLSSRVVSSVAAQGLLQPLDELVPRLDVSDYSPGMWEASRFDNVQYAIPARASSMVMYYNKAVFDKAGVKYPDHKWTYADLLKTSRDLTMGDQYGIGLSADLSDPGAAMDFLLPVIWGHGGDFLSKDLSKATTTTPEFIKGLQYWTDLYAKYHVAPEGTPNFNIPRDVIPLFQANRVGIFASDGSAFTELSKNPALDWGMVLLPGGLSKATGWTMGIPVGAKNPDAAKVFLLWLSDPKIMAQVMNRPPARISALALPPWNDPAQEIFARAAENTRPTPTSPFWTSIEVVVLTEAQKVLVGQSTVSAAAQAMAKQIDAIIAKG